MLNLRLFPVYLAITIWILWASYMGLTDSWYLFAENWFMAVTMALGSFIAGATSEGGGAVAFPVMTLLFDIQPSIAREFSLMIQSVGMTAAALTIIALRIKVAWRTIPFVSVGGMFGVVIGIEWIAPLMSPPIIKLFFTSLWLAFGFVLFWTNRHHDREVYQDISMTGNSHATRLLLLGLVGGMVSGITGSGLDIITFSFLILFYRVCETVATPTSVILMAINSLCAFVWMEGVSTGVTAEAWNYWLVCIPIVVVGAPLGAWFIRNKSRFFIAGILYVSIISQYVGALFILPINATLVLFSMAVILVGFLCFWVTIYYGKRADSQS